MELTLDLPAAHEADVAASRGAASFAVESAAALQPDEEDVERYPAPDEPCAGTRTDRVPRFVAPAPPRLRRPRRR